MIRMIVMFLGSESPSEHDARLTQGKGQRIPEAEGDEEQPAEWGVFDEMSEGHGGEIVGALKG